MDTLTFNSPILLRHLTFSEAKKMPISEICLDRALEGLQMSMGQVRLPFLNSSVGVHLEFENLAVAPWSADPRSLLIGSSLSYVFFWGVITSNRLKAWAPNRR
jgi:hypothetical protein